MLKHKKEIIIQNEHLRKIRNSLRELWIRIVYDGIEILRNFDTLYDWSNLTPDEEDESGILQVKITKLFGLVSKSICPCSICTNTDRDMIYIPDHETWYCNECQEKELIWNPSQGSELDFLNQEYINWYFEQKKKFVKRNLNDDNLDLS